MIIVEINICQIIYKKSIVDKNCLNLIYRGWHILSYTGRLTAFLLYKYISTLIYLSMYLYPVLSMWDVSICVLTYLHTYLITYWKYWGHVEWGVIQFIVNHSFSYSYLDIILFLRPYFIIIQIPIWSMLLKLSRVINGWLHPFEFSDRLSSKVKFWP